ncbi:PREDICTED: uncharacterized protein LOC104802362 isoform X2 [Tarenaya hassleriana]|uniref:uncharacterized protein LOC104802362 isoform X2 n=1 Tax=Tarenaya hassleriana TaxID=28532 RepID=UPI00053C7CFC|nr:PREDICTED: uncharacterized protein LOC104802362 isoform X2 [Tarenaya hassleriana]
MAADQRRKRMNSANIVGFCSREHYRTKKKKIAPPSSHLNTRDHINLEWDSNRNKVVAKREQVGISLRHLRQFVNPVPRRQNFLADVCLVPEEFFELENMSEVLSYEVWQSLLSEGERSYLQQFLPKGVDVEQVVQALLDGDNFHFGNPFLDWGTAVCSGEFHPDGILSQEERIRADKRQYYSELQKYHYQIIDYLQELKEKWESCKDPERDIVTHMWGRLRGKNANATTSRQDLEQDLTAPSESCSWDADEKPCSSDNKNASVARTREVQKRSKSFAKSRERKKSGSSSVALDSAVNIGAKARKKDKLPKHHSQQTDGAKYMSYLKISKKQYQIVTSMKQSGTSIQSRALNRILGNIETLDVQPYGVFVEEEKEKLNAHWLQLVKDIPAAYAIWKKLELQKRDIIKSVEGELKDKVNPWMEDEQKLYHADNPLGKDDFHRNKDTVEEDKKGLILDQNSDSAPLQEPDVEISGNSSQLSTRNDFPPALELSYYSKQTRDSGQCLQLAPSSSQISSPDCGNNVNLNDIEKKQYSFPCSPNCDHDITEKKAEEDEYSCALQDQSLPQASPASEHHALELNNINSIGKKHISEMENSSSVMPELSTNLRIPSSHEYSQFCSSGDVWQPMGGNGQSYIDREAYTSGGLSIVHNPRGNEEESFHNPQGEEEESRNCFVGLASDVRKEDDRKNILQTQPDGGSFGSFPNNDRKELLHSLFKGQDMPSHHLEQLHILLRGPHNEEHKQMMGMDFQEPSNSLMDGGQFSGHFPVQMPPPHAMAQNQQTQNHIYGVGSISENIYCDGREFLMQRQDWDTSSAQMGVTIHPQLSTGPVLSQNWQLRSVWADTNGLGCASQGNQARANRDPSLLRGVSEAEQILHRGNSSDQSLFSVLSRCSQLHHSRTPCESTSANDRFVAPSNYGMMTGGAAQMMLGG